MSNIKKLAVLSVLIAGAIWLFSVFSLRLGSSDTKSIPEAKETQQQTKSEPPAEVQPAPIGQDPFKKFLDEKPNNPSSSVKPENTNATPSQAGKDPFKEFLEKQKQISKDQVVSPFGKN